MMFRDETGKLMFASWATHEKDGRDLLVTGMRSRVILADEVLRLELVEGGDQDRIRLAYYVQRGKPR